MFRAYFGPAGIPVGCEERSTEAGVVYTAEIGLQAFECQFVRGVRMSIGSARKLGEVADDHDVLLSVHAPYYVNLASLKEDTIEKSKGRIVQAAQRAAAMGTEIVVVHPGYYSGRSKTEAYGLVKEAVEDVIEKLEAQKIQDVKIGLETMGRQKQFGTINEVLNMAGEVERAVPVLDFAHIHARNNGCFYEVGDYLDLFEEVEEKLGRDSLQQLHTHFTDVYYSGGNEKKHVVLGEGDLRFEPLAEAILELGIQPTIICESPILEEDALKLQTILEEIG